MSAALIGNIMISNIRTNISATTATGVTSGANQVLASNILANPTLGSGNYTYQWSFTGTTITFTAATSNSTNCTYGSLSVSGSTTIFCTVTDTWTGVKSVTSNCVITWPVQTIPITAVTWSIGGATSSTYNGSSQSVTVVSVSPPGATYNTSTQTAINAGSVVSTTITGTGTYTGSFTSPNLTIAQKQLTITGSAGITFCSYNSNPGQFYGQTLTVSLYDPGSPPSCQGLLSGGIGTLTTYLVNKVTLASSVAPVSTNDNVFNDAVSVTQGVNPKTGLSNGTQTVNVCFPGGTYYYGFSFGGDSNYLPSPVTALNGDSCNT